MFEDLELSKEKVNFYLKNVENYLRALEEKGVRTLYLDAVEKLKKELNLFDNNIKNILENFISEISSKKYYSFDEEINNINLILDTNFVEKIDFDILQKYNLNFKERLNGLNLNYIETIEFEDDIQFYKLLLDSTEHVKELRLDLLKFYREIKNKNKSSSDGMIKQENDFYYYISEKKNEIDMTFVSFENKIKSIVSKYNVANDDLDDLNKSYLDIGEKVKGIYGQLTEINSNIFNLSDDLNKKINDFDMQLNFRANRVERKLHNDLLEVVKGFTKELDETDILIKSEVESISKTSKSFKDFISDETAIRLTDDYKNKAKWEMRAYYLFNFISLLIIGFAIYFSYSSLSDFATKHTGNYTSLDLAYLGIRLIFSILIFSTIAFTSRLASKSYIYWKKNEGIFLRLTALKSFIADMSESKKVEIHEKLVDVYFGKDEQDQNLNQKLKDLPNNITQLLGKVVDQTSVVLDASKPKKDTQPPASGQTDG